MVRADSFLGFRTRSNTSRVSFLASIAILVLSFSLLLAPSLQAERIFFAGYKGGFYIKSEEEGGMELRLGGSFQADYRYYLENERADNRFDIRRARLIFRGQLTRWFRFGMEYEFQGNETNNLVDAYGEWVISGLQALRFGQFKEPFSLEWQTSTKAIFFAERSMGYYLTPKYDIGLMLHGSMMQDSINYACGLFNGDGDDGSTRGDETDTPEIAARIVVHPFGEAFSRSLQNVQVGGSFTYAQIDLANLDLKIKSTGMAGSSRNIYVLGHDTKFGVLQDVDTRIRAGLELGWANGPLGFMSEYIWMRYSDLKPATGPSEDATLSSWYASGVYCLTGEHLVFSGGVMKPVYPNRFFNPEEGTWGAFCIAARYEHFDGDEAWIREGTSVSVREADALSAALTWHLFPMYQILVDYTYTDLSDQIKVRVNTDGSIDYIDNENVLTLRFSMDF
ncbi:MAG: OprO/OprP family phosphate-selective porin [Desulfomonilia bacterium]